MEVTPPFAGENRITATLRCFGPNGANVSEVVIRADGSLKFHGEESLAKAPLAALRSVDLRRFGNRRIL